jgi:hypothetical protein
MRNIIYTAEELRGSLTTLRNEGIKKGAWTGFDSLYDKYSVKKGSTTYIYAGAHQGKSQFAFELMMNLSQFWIGNGQCTPLRQVLLQKYLRSCYGCTCVNHS